ncbi:MAG: hypothetical protein ACI379_14745 [Nocardioides sp.]|uniref:hypothetical protein n=1 Tax=Nocardioides sp. TaxID=35761 RepID=UPI003EFF4415
MLTAGAALAVAATFVPGAPALADEAVPGPVDRAAVPDLTRAVALPTAAVAMGDSFISGEGAEAYQAVTDVNGTSQGFPGWSAPNSNPYFCHRSANASINRATLPGISQRFNIACSGAQPADLTQPSAARANGRTVDSQVNQLRAIAQSNDIDLVLLGIGSNNATFTFGEVAAECAGRFVGDGFTGWWEVWLHFINWVSGTTLTERPCSDDDLATTAEFSAAQAQTLAEVRTVLDVLDEIDADGQHRVVLQDYTNPLPTQYAAQYLDEDGRTDTRDKFRDLVRERYAAGCPAHVASLAPAHRFSQRLGGLVGNVATTLQAERPGAQITYLDVQGAFNGARLCEAPGSPGTALATPLRVMDGPTGVKVTSFSGYDKLDIKRVTDTCKSYYQTCQESWHPSAAGHGVLGQCLASVWASPAVRVTCVRENGQVVTR